MRVPGLVTRTLQLESPGIFELYRPWEGGWVDVLNLEASISVNRADFLIYRWKGVRDDQCRRIGCIIHILHEFLVRASPYEPPLPVPPQYVDRRDFPANRNWEQ